MKILVTTFSIALLSISLANAEDPGLKPMSDTSLRFGSGSLPLETFGQSALGACSNNLIVPTVNIFSLNMSVMKPMGVFTCMGSRYSLGPRFTSTSCQKLVSCRQSIENGGAEVEKATKVLNEIIARDYIKNSIVMNGDDMERLEVLTKFAQKKYDKNLGAQCLSRFQSEGNSKCDLDLVENAFEERQKNCSFGIGCYSNTNIELNLDNYEKFKKDNPSKYGKFTKEYFKYRTEKTVDLKMDEDEKRVKSLASLAGSAEYKKAKNDQKINLIINTIGKDLHGRLKDPIIGYEFGNDNPSNPKNADKFKELIKLMDSKGTSKDIEKDFSASFDNYRKKRAEAILGGANICSKTNTLLQICSDATKIAKGEKVRKDSQVIEHLTSMTTEKGIDFIHLKDILGTKFDEEDYDNLLNAKRCVAFGYVDEWGNALSQQDTSSSVASTVTGGEGRTPSESRGEREPEVGPVGDSAPSKKGESASDASGKISSNSPVDSKGEALPLDSQSSSEDLGQDSAKDLAHAPQAQVPSAFNDMFSNTSNFDSFGPKAKVKADEVVDKVEDAPVNTGTTASQDRMNEYLMKKLAAAEENLEKLKADAEEAEEDRAKQKKVDEEAALIKDLKGQISDLKTQSAKNNEKRVAEAAAQASEQSRAASVNNSHSYNSGSSVITTRGDAPAAKAQAAESYEAKASAASAPQSSSSRSGSSAILSSTSNSDGSRTTTLGSGLVVTTVDGMTTEKAQQTISNRILELNGIPFYIEEGGMVKEIIAVVKDGKVLLDENGQPIFEKIVKGKVGDKKFAAKVKDKKDRAPAAITDAADLKRDQEEKLKRERAEYLKLKNLTNGALKKK